ncbi:DUF503 domain-containing protein [Candidatus Zixiibacteriota bacterium]
MIVGVCTIELYIAESGSLKSKRQVLRALKDRVRNAFNVSISEVDHHDLWQRATLGVAIISTDTPFVHKVLNKVVNLIGRESRAEIIDWTVEIR